MPGDSGGIPRLLPQPTTVLLGDEPIPESEFMLAWQAIQQGDEPTDEIETGLDDRQFSGGPTRTGRGGHREEKREERMKKIRGASGATGT